MAKTEVIFAFPTQMAQSFFQGMTQLFVCLASKQQAKGGRDMKAPHLTSVREEVIHRCRPRVPQG